MTEGIFWTLSEEDDLRSGFLETWAESLPADLCPLIGEEMEKWEIRTNVPDP